MKKGKKITLFTLGMAMCNFIGKSDEIVKFPKEYSENIAIDGQDIYKYDYDFDGDGTLEKVVVSRKSDSLSTKNWLVSIYTMQ